MPLPYLEGLKFYVRKLRAEMADCETLLWSKIRRKQLLGVQFYRQKPISSYILDFYSNFLKIAIELDSGHHYLPEQTEKDDVRDLFLESLGIKVLRFDNLQVIQKCDSVLQMIAGTILAEKRQLRDEMKG